MVHIINYTNDELNFVTDHEVTENDITVLANNVLETPFFDVAVRKQFGDAKDPEAYFYKITPIQPKFVT